MEAWFISDIHIKSLEERNSKILLRFLHSLLERDVKNMRLFLVGDIFDLWVGGHDIFVRKFQPLVDAVRALHDAGVLVTYIEGNHDVHVHAFWTKKLGVEVLVEAQFYELNGLVVRVEHGDLINLEDKTYLRYRSIIRNPFVQPLGHIIPGIFWEEAGKIAAKKSRARSQTYRVQNEEKLVQMIRNHAHRVYEQRPFDVVISGHMHVIDDYQFQIGVRKSRSINLGSWYTPEVKALKLTGQNFEWVTLN
ncbi:MAG: UDP-2,3-diacylglucosamine diphosphatase [Proteobacteria bacterium]|nr:MAG: UDP-2,3-diacylglucosamine diphosphatase [Pseudomonadota bacterium]